jgi:organic hydroperoxide reductase OsmC/OhrA
MAETFTTLLDWSGAAKGATRDAAAFSRDLELSACGMSLPLSSAPGFKGDAARLNPEVMFVGALSACQALTYLFLAARKQVVVTAYVDAAEGVLETVDGKMRMSRVTLRPRITLEAGSNEATARALVSRAHDGCFIANSVTATVDIEPVFDWAPAPAVVA